MFFMFRKFYEVKRKSLKMMTYHTEKKKLWLQNTIPCTVLVGYSPRKKRITKNLNLNSFREFPSWLSGEQI